MNRAILAGSVIVGIVAMLSAGSIGPAFAITNITDCSDFIDTDGETYLVTQDLATSGTCLTIDADNATLDCQGYVLTGDGSGAISNYQI